MSKIINGDILSVGSAIMYYNIQITDFFRKEKMPRKKKKRFKNGKLITINKGPSIGRTGSLYYSDISIDKTHPKT